jgi:hypothetical protein
MIVTMTLAAYLYARHGVCVIQDTRLVIRSVYKNLNLLELQMLLDQLIFINFLN